MADPGKQIQGGYAFLEWESGNVDFGDGTSWNVDHREDTVHQTYIIGKPEDGSSEDLRTVLELSDVVDAIYFNRVSPGPRPASAGRDLVNREWLAQQLWLGAFNSRHSGGGYDRVSLEIIDVYSHSIWTWDVIVGGEESSSSEPWVWKRIA